VNGQSTSYRVFTLLLTKKNPGFSRTPMINFPGLFRSPEMFRYKEEKTLPSPPDPSSLPFPSLRSRTLQIQLGNLGERCEFPQDGVWGGAPAEIKFGAF